MTFYEWLQHEHGNEESPIGDLSFDALNDRTFPKGMIDKADLVSYLRSVGASSSCLAVAKEAWEEYAAMHSPFGLGLRVGGDAGILLMMQNEVDRLNREKGWHDEQRTFGDDIALLHSEASEALEEYRDHGTGNPTLQDCIDAGRHWRHEDDVEPHLCKPTGIASEFADVLVRLLDTCARYDIDLFAEWRRKMDFNWTRPTKHGGKRL